MPSELEPTRRLRFGDPAEITDVAKLRQMVYLYDTALGAVESEYAALNSEKIKITRERDTLQRQAELIDVKYIEDQLNEATALRKQFDELKSHAETQAKTISAQELQISLAKTKLAAAATELSEQRTQLRSKDDEIKELRGQLSEKRVEQMQLEAKLSDQRELLRAGNALLAGTALIIAMLTISIAHVIMLPMSAPLFNLVLAILAAATCACLIYSIAKYLSVLLPDGWLSRLNPARLFKKSKSTTPKEK